MSGGLSAAMIDAAIPLPPAGRCIDEARSEVRRRTGAWIHRATVIIQSHNDNIKHERVCGHCNMAAPIVWE